MGSFSELGLPLPHQAHEKKFNKLCFIGRNLDRPLQACIFNGKYLDPGEPPSCASSSLIAFEPMSAPGLWYREPLWETGRFVPTKFNSTTLL